MINAYFKFSSPKNKMAAPMSQTIADFVNGSSDTAAKQIASEINKKNAKFLDFIESLGASLTNDSTVVRGRATGLIGDVLALLPPSFLSNEQVKVVASFLQAKLADHHSVQPSAIQTLSILTNRCSPLPDDVPQQICLTIFREIQNQTLSQKDRCANYTIFQNLLGSSLQELKSMGGDFVIGFIQQIDAEKDPRNLLLVFSCAQFICSNLKLGPFAEEMFEVLGCYFPIEFTPNPNDANGITKEELISALRKCFASTVDFAPYCLSLLLEKLTSDLQSARLDAFQTLAAKEKVKELENIEKALKEEESLLKYYRLYLEKTFNIECSPVYGRKGLEEFHGSVLSTAKREVLMGISVDLVHVARNTITALFKVLYSSVLGDTGKDGRLSASIAEFYQDFSKFIGGSDSVKSCLAMSMCTAMAKSSPQALSIVLPLALPDFLRQCGDQTEETGQAVFFQEINGILKSLKDFASDAEVQESFSSVSLQILDLYGKAFTTCTNTLFCMEVIKGLTFLLTADGLVNPENKSKLIKDLSQRALSEQDKDIRDEILKSLKLCLKANPEESQAIVDQLLDCLTSNKDRTCVLETLKYAVVDHASFSKSCDVLINQLSNPLQDNQYQIVLENVEGLSGLVNSRHEESKSCEFLLKVSISLLRVSVSLSSQWSLEEEDKYSEYLQSCRDIFKMASNSLSPTETSSLECHIVEFMKEGRVPVPGSEGESSVLRPLQANSPWTQTRLVSILEGFLTGAPFQSFANSSEDLFESVYTLASYSSDEFTHSSACRCAAVIINKAGYGSQIHWLLETITQQLKERMEGSEPLLVKKNSLWLWAWLTKGLECRGHSAVAIFSAQLVCMLNDPTLGQEAALCLGLVVEDKVWLLSSKWNSSMTPLYKQRFFTINLKSLLRGYEEAKAKPDIKENYLSAFSHITSNLPLQVLKPHLTKLVPILLLSLDRPTERSHHHSLSTLSSAIANAPDAVSPSVDALIPKLLGVAKNYPFMQSRIASLECLEQMVKLPIHCIIPHQNNVVRELDATLDDKKRLVRKQAVETRSAWILLEPSDK